MAIVVVILIILLSVSMHYYVLNRLNAVIDKKKSTQQWMVLLTVVSILIVHFIEILAFSLVYWLFDIHFGVETLEEAVYLSFLSYTTLGFSDFELLSISFRCRSIVRTITHCMVGFIYLYCHAPIMGV